MKKCEVCHVETTEEFYYYSVVSERYHYNFYGVRSPNTYSHFFDVYCCSDCRFSDQIEVPKYINRKQFKKWLMLYLRKDKYGKENN